MQEVTQLLRKKGQKLVNELENEISFARYHLPVSATDVQREKVEDKVKTLKGVIEKVQAVFELPSK